LDFPDDLRYAEESLKQAEKEFLAGDDGIAEALLSLCKMESMGEAI
jgi:hypothetical protein